MTTPQQPQQPHTSTIVTGAAAGVAATAVVAAGPAQAAGNKTGQPTLTVLGTTDLHGNVFNWDYFKNAEYDDAAHNDIGLAKVATLVNGERASRTRRAGADLDAGDTIQGTPLAYYYAKIEPITDGGDPPDGARR